MQDEYVSIFCLYVESEVVNAVLSRSERFGVSALVVVGLRVHELVLADGLHHLVLRRLCGDGSIVAELHFRITVLNGVSEAVCLALLRRECPRVCLARR